MTNIVDFPSAKQPEKLIPTPTSQNILDAVSDCLRNDWLIVIQTGAGLGKTSCLRAFARDHAYAATLVTLSPAAKSPTAAMSATLEALKDRKARECTSSFRSLSRHRDPIMHRLYRSFSEILAMTDDIRSLHGRALIMVDEAQHATQETLDTFRALFDEGLCGLVIAGNDQLFNARRGRMVAADFGPLLSRAHHVIHVPHATIGDVDAILDAYRISGQQARDLLHSRAGQGGLREVVAIIQKARELSGTDLVGYKHVKAAAATTGLSAFRPTTGRR